MNKEDIKKVLRAAGASEKDLEKMIEDVKSLILRKAMDKYSQKLTEEQRKTLSSLPESQIQSYIEEHKSEFPPMDSKELEGVAKQTWSEYLATVTK
jgi:ribosome maturation protein Sdo1